MAKNHERFMKWCKNTLCKVSNCKILDIPLFLKCFPTYYTTFHGITKWSIWLAVIQKRTQNVWHFVNTHILLESFLSRIAKLANNHERFLNWCKKTLFEIFNCKILDIPVFLKCFPTYYTTYHGITQWSIWLTNSQV